MARWLGGLVAGWLGDLVTWWLGGLVAWWVGGLVAWWLGDWARVNPLFGAYFVPNLRHNSQKT